MLKAGFGTVNITPPLGCALQGYFGPRTSELIHDPLFASSMVIDDGNQRICLISCDLATLNSEITDKTRALLKERFSIPEDNVIICVTHTHTGPYVNKLSTLSPKNKTVNKEWLSMLPSYLCSATTHAMNSLDTTKVVWMKGREENVSFNRRYLMKDGTVKTNPGIGNPDIVKPIGPIDPDVGIVAFGEDYLNIKGLVVNFALHLDTIGGNNISADFPGVMRKTIRKFTGEDTGIVYTSGAMGDINHINFMGNKTEFEYFEFSQRIGTVLGAEVVKNISKIENFESEAKINTGRTLLKLPLKQYDDESLEKARKNVLLTPGLHNLEYLSGLGMLKASRLGKDEVTTEIVAFSIGEVAFVSIPGEYFVELGLHIKKNSPFPFTFIVELGMENLGYIAHSQAYDQQGYEPVSSPFARGAGEILAEKAIDLLKSIR
ncbi:neutral/alkaline non-lysosomal ceramidase N-terminal domain-containing protein [bacterium]|nr:neutral/alkaline non-lysosomal ceramidase N-terminal domain-containing protein [bacterium]